jgi:hypothetical protein
MQRRTFLMTGGAVATVAGAYGIQRYMNGDAMAPFLPPPGTNQLGGGLNYAFADRAIIDYQVYERERYWLRGPDPGPLEPGNYISFAGAAQTFGRFSERPFATLVGNALKQKVLNLGLTAAGPGAFADRPQLLEWINASRFLVLQVMAGRSAGNSLMQNLDGGRMVSYHGEKMTAEDAWDKAIADPTLSAEQFWSAVDETREYWLVKYESLLEQVRVPVILLYIGANAPRCTDDRRLKPATLWDLFGRYPQLVTRSMVDTVAGRCTRYVESITGLGLPQRLPKVVDMSGGGKNGGQPGDINDYYPSPEMHLAAARNLFPVCREFWTG